MYACAAERIDVEFFQLTALCTGECGRVGRAVFLDDLKLQLRPPADLVELKGADHRQTLAGRSSCFIGMRELVGNWLHSLPSRSRPPLFGERPPHCLKKNGTRASMH